MPVVVTDVKCFRSKMGILAINIILEIILLIKNGCYCCFKFKL